MRIVGDRLASSQLYWKHKEEFPHGFGFAIVRGRHHMAEEALCKIAPVRIWVDEDNIECLRQLLNSRRNWTPHPGEANEAFCERKSFEENS